MLDFAYISKDSFVHRLDPRIKFPCLILFAFLILFTNGITGTFLALCLISSLSLLSKLSFQEVLSPLKRIWFILTFIFLMNAIFFDDGKCLYSKGLLCISTSGMLHGYNIVLHMFAVSAVSVIYIRTTSSVGIMKSMEFYMQPLQKFGIPVRDTALMMSVALQFIPVFFSDFDRIKKAQTVRGVDFLNGSLIDKFKTVYPLVIPAFVSAFRRADELAMAIDARGYNSDRKDDND